MTFLSCKGKLMIPISNLLSAIENHDVSKFWKNLKHSMWFMQQAQGWACENAPVQIFRLMVYLHGRVSLRGGD